MAETALNPFPVVETETLDEPDENSSLHLELVPELAIDGTAIGQQAVSVTMELVVDEPQEDPVIQHERLLRQARRILTARARSNPFQTDVRQSDATKISKDGAEIRADNWQAFAECLQDHPDAMFVRGTEQHKAKKLCLNCDVRRECLAEALDNKIEWGVWGGMTERERRALLKKNNWHRIFPPSAESRPKSQESA